MQLTVVHGNTMQAKSKSEVCTYKRYLKQVTRNDTPWKIIFEVLNIQTMDSNPVEALIFSGFFFPIA